MRKSNWIMKPQASGWTWKIFELPPPRFPSNHLHQRSVYYQSNQFFHISWRVIYQNSTICIKFDPPKSGSFDNNPDPTLWFWRILGLKVFASPPIKKCPISWRYLHLPIHRECSWDRQICRWSGFTETPSIMAFNLGSRWVADWPIGGRRWKKGWIFSKMNGRWHQKMTRRCFFENFGVFFLVANYSCGNLISFGYFKNRILWMVWPIVWGISS